MNSLIKGNCQILAIFPIHEKLEMTCLMSRVFVWKNTKSLKPSKQHEATGYNETLNMSQEVTPWTAAHQAPPSMGFSRQEYWSGLPFLLQGTFPIQGRNPGLPHCRQILYHLSHQGSPNQEQVSELKKCSHVTCLSCFSPPVTILVPFDFHSSIPSA